MNPAVEWALRWHILLAELLFGFTPRFLSGFRTRQEQLDLFSGRVRTPNPVRPPGTSQHEFGFAYDLAPDVRPGQPGYAERLKQLRELGLALGMRWGGSDDPQHFQAWPLALWDSVISVAAPRRGVL